MRNINISSAQLNRWRNLSFLFAAVGAGVCLLGALAYRAQFFQSYLVGYIFWFSIAMGCLGLLMLHHVVGGAWGDLVRPMLEAGAMTLPWLAALYLPLVKGFPFLYAWARPAEVAADPILQHKQIYLNIPFVLFRSGLFFALWIFAAWRLNQYSDRSDHKKSERGRKLSGPGLVVYILTLHFASVDWLMSLEPHWYSTIYGVVIMSGSVLGAIALLICGLALFGSLRKLTTELPSKPFLDLGNMLLAFVMFWAYIGFSQYLIIWSANIPEEIIWYIHRQSQGWYVVEMILVAFGFLFPFLFLLGRVNKKRPQRLWPVAVLVLMVHGVDIFWLITPTFHPEGFHIHWLDAVTFLTIAAVWMGAWLGQLKTRERVIGTYQGEVHE